jgi:hypothetical protein
MGRYKTTDIDRFVKRMDTWNVEDEDEDATHSSDDEAVDAFQPFRFLDLPYELRLRVYEELLVFPKTFDLDPDNARTVAPHLRLFRVSPRIHEEASRVFYSRNTFRIFPVHSTFINRKHALLSFTPKKYRAYMTRLELRVGPGFNSPPKNWVVDSRLGLAAATRVYKLKIFVQLDPGCHPSFDGFRLDNNYYTQYCVGWLRGLLAQLAGCTEVEFDAWSGVEKDSQLLLALVDEAKLNQKRITWGPERGWENLTVVDLAGMVAKLAL